MALRRTAEGEIQQTFLEEVARNGDSGVCPRTNRSLVRGGDLLAVVGVALRRAVGTRTKAQAAPDLLGEILRSSADVDWLRSSDWFAELAKIAALPE